MTQLINEINRYRGLMGLQDLNEVLLTNNGNKNLLLEARINPPKFNFPKAKFEGKPISNFDQLKKYAATKGITDIGLKNTSEFNAFNSTIPDIATLSKRLESGTAYRNFLDNIYRLRNKVPEIITQTEEILNNIKRNAGKGSFGKGTKRQRLLDALGPDADGLNLENWDNSYGFRDQLLWAYKNLDPEGYEKLKLKFKDANTIDKSILDSEVPDKPVVNTKSLDDSIKSKIDPATSKKYKPNEVKEKWKLAGGDETKLDIAWNQRGWVPGQKVPKDLKVKGGSPKPTTPTVSPGGRYKVGTVGYLIESTPKPDGSGYYEFSDVADEWRAKGGADNTALGKAWKENWRPGNEIPEKYSASYKSETKAKSEKIVNSSKIDESDNLSLLINNENKLKGSDPRNPLYTIEKLKDDFNLDINTTPDQLKKLTEAWNAGYRGSIGTPKFLEQNPKFIVKDSELAIQRLVKNTEDTDSMGKSWDFQTSKSKFGLSENPKGGDLEKFYRAWEEGWRPKTRAGADNPVPKEYQTDLYVQREKVKRGDIFKDLPKELIDDPNAITRSFRAVGRFFAFRQIGFWEDGIINLFKKQEKNLQSKVDVILKDALNKIYTSKGGTIDWFYLRKQILRCGPDGDVAAGFKLSLLDEYKSTMLKEIDDLGLEGVRNTLAKDAVNDLFERLKGKNLEQITKESEEWGAWFGGLVSDRTSLTLVDAVSDVYKNNTWLKSTYDIFWKKYVGKPSAKKFAITVTERVLNLVRSGSVWTNAELLAMRSVDKFQVKAAWKDFFIRKAIQKVALPILYVSAVLILNDTGIRTEEWLGKDIGIFSQDPWYKQMIKEVSNEFLISEALKQKLGDDKTTTGWSIIRLVSTITGTEIDDYGAAYASTFRTEDEVTGQYKIKYLNPGKKFAGYEATQPSWEYYPQKNFQTYEDVNKKVLELRSQDNVRYICDLSKVKGENTKELDIPKTYKEFCNGTNYINQNHKFHCNPQTGNCIEQTDPKYTGTLYTTLDDCASKSKCNDQNKEWEKTKDKTKLEKEAEELRKKIEDKKPEENKTTVKPSQGIIFINNVVKNRTDDGKTWSSLEKNGTFQPLVDAKNGEAWSMEFDNVIYIYSVTADGKVYEKSIPKEQFTKENLNNINSDNGWNEVKSSITVVEEVYRKIKKIISTEMKLGNRRRIFEEKDEKFGEEKFEHWKKTFEFSSQDPETKDWKRIEKETIESKQVDIEKWVEHYLKSNDEDDAFVRAVIHVFKMDKNEKNHVKKVAFNKGLAHLSENFEVGGLLRVLSVIRESKELEIWSVKYYADGNWELVKGSFTDDELKNVGKTVKDREKKDEERKKPVEGLKKKELTGIQLLNQDEKEGLVELPSQVKRKLLEKLRKGWVTERPYEFFNEFYSVSNINTVFNDKLKIYKLNPTKEFFESLVQNSPRIFPRKGICKSLDNLESTEGSNEKSKSVLNHILQKCQTKFKGEYGVKQTKTN
jgi:hypothetical protein